MFMRPLARCVVSLVLAGVVLTIFMVVLEQVWTAQAESDTNGAIQAQASTDWVVGGPCGATIQACINNSSVVAGDRILIPAGRYTESLVLNKAVSLIGAGAQTSVIHAVDSDRVMFVTGSAITASTVISGLTFTGGSLTGFSCPGGCGGGILITGTARPLIQYSVIATNHTEFHGAGLYADVNSPLTLTNVTVMSNVADFGNGGGVYALGPVTLISGRFERNDSAHGGGLYVSNTLTLSGTTFISNTTFGRGGGAYAASATTLTGGRFENNQTGSNVNMSWGGGLAVFGSLSLTGTEFIGNAAEQGGGVFVVGPATLTDARLERNVAGYVAGGLIAYGTFTGDDTEFIGNTAEFGGGAARLQGPTTLIRGRIENNRTNVGSGGGLESFNALTISATTLISNTAAGNGGGVFHASIFEGPIGNGRIVNALFARNTAGQSGAGLYLASGGNVAILHATIADNVLNAAQAVVVVSGTVGITDTIITSHTVAISQTDGTVYQDYNLFFGNTMTQAGAVAGGSHSLNGNPAFVNPALDNYHVMTGSAAIDAGVNAGVAIDIDGGPRPAGAGFDIGVDEYLPLTHHIYLPLALKNF